MKTLFLAVGLGLLAALQAGHVQASKEVAGKWYLKALNEDIDRPGEEKMEAVTPLSLTLLEGGDLEGTVTMLVEGQCHTITQILKKTNKPGKYTMYNGRLSMSFFPSRVKDHYMVYVEGEIFEGQFRALELLGRSLERSDAALTEFQREVKARDLSLDILVPKQIETCSPRRD